MDSNEDLKNCAKKTAFKATIVTNEWNETMTDTITINRDYFEHLISCLANQKFMGDFNADSIEAGEGVYNKTNKLMQEAIDKAYMEGLDLLKRDNPQPKQGAK